MSGTPQLWWTEADAAELDVLVYELIRGCFEHRKHCDACSECTELLAWRSYLDECSACRGDAPLDHGLPCDRYYEFVGHGKTCARCNPCPRLSRAIEAVVDWRDARELLSRAEWLRAERNRIEAA